MRKTIANNQLRLEDLPSPDADWQTLANFALTFNGYEVWGSFEKCAGVANSRQDSTLTELRTCLFFEQRRWRHFGEAPDVEAMEYVRSILEKIRVKVLAGEVE